MKVWDAETGSEVLTLRGGKGLVESVAFSPDGNRMASGGGAVLVWDAREVTPELRVEREAVSLLRFLFNKRLPKREVMERVKADQTISEEVRRKALEMAEHYRDKTD